VADGPGLLMVAPVTSEDERVFLFDPKALSRLRDVRTLGEVLPQLLGRKVWVVEREPRWGAGSGRVDVRRGKLTR
jgi:hypothetical protein